MVLKIGRVPNLLFEDTGISGEDDSVLGIFGDRNQSRFNMENVQVIDIWPGVSVDATKWVSFTQNTGTILVASNELTLSTGTTSNSFAQVTSVKRINLGEASRIILEAKIKVSAVASFAADWGLVLPGEATDGFVIFQVDTASATNVICNTQDLLENQDIKTISGITTTNYNYYKIILDRERVQYFVNGELVYEVKNTTTGFPKNFIIARAKLSANNQAGIDRDMFSKAVRVTIQ